MAAELFLFPFPVALNANGVVVPGAKLYYYLTGTSTPTSVYADSGLVTPLSNPVVANSAGVWPAIYYDTTVVYRVVLKDSADAVLGEVDPYVPGVLGGMTAAFETLYTDTVAEAAAAEASATAAAESEDNAAISAAAAAEEVADGYHYHPVFGTRFSGYELIDGVLTDVVAPELYWDPFKSGASGDGTTHAEAVKTSTEVRAWLALNTGRRTVAVHAGDQTWIRDSLDLAEGNTGNGNTTRDQLSLVSYSTDGSQKLAFFNGMDGVDAADWAAHGSISNAYQVSWAHQVYAVSTANLRVFQTLNGKLQPLSRVQTEAETSAEGTYWYDNTLSAAGTETVVAHFWDDVDPTGEADGYAEITVREYAFSGHDNCFAQGIGGFATAHNNGSLFMYTGGAIGCFLEEGTKHNWVAGAHDFRGVVCFNAYTSNTYVGTATSPALATAYNPDPDNAIYTLTDCFSICDPDYYDNSDGGYAWAAAFYCHGTSSGVGGLVMTGGGDNCVSWASEAGAHTITGYTVYRRESNSDGLVGANMTVRNCLIMDARNGIEGTGTAFVAEENVIVSTKDGNTADIYTTVPNARIVRNIISQPGAYSQPRIWLTAPGSPVIEENVIDGGGGSTGAVRFGAVATGTARLNKNYYLRPSDPGGGDYPNLLRVNATSYADLADVQGLGYEADGGATALDTIADAKFTAGQAPTPTALDVRFDADSPVLTRQSEQIAQTDVNALDEQVSTKVSRAAAITWVQGYAWYPVRVQLDAETWYVSDLPAGGTTGQVLAKASAADYDVEWVDAASGSGTVTSVSVVTANGISGTVANATTTPAITLALGDITPSSVTVSGVTTANGGFSTGGTNISTLGGRINLGTGDIINGGAISATTLTASGNVTGANLSGTNTGDQDLSSYATTAAVAAGYQPLDSDLTSIAALTTTSFGRSFLPLADAAAGRTLLALGTAALSASTDFAAAAHVGAGGTSHANAVAGGDAGFMTGADKTKLDGVAASATANPGMSLWDHWHETWTSQNGSNFGAKWVGAAISGGSTSTQPGTTGMAGYNIDGTQLSSSATAGSGYRINTITMARNYFGTIAQKFRLWAMPYTLTSVVSFIGFHDTTGGSDPVDGAYFAISGTTVSAVTANNSSRTTHGTTYTLAINTAYVFDVEVNAAGTEARFRIYEGQNETAVYDQTITTNIPTTAARGFGSGITTTYTPGGALGIWVVYGLGQGTVPGFNRARG